MVLNRRHSLEDRPPVHLRDRLWCGVPVWTWLIGVVIPLLLLGPALAPGSILNLDLVLVPDPPIPAGVWGLGPELPRRVPMWVFMTWLSTVFGGDLVGKAFVVVAFAAAFAGMYRLIQAPVLARLGGATIYTLSPFLLTRVAVGHWMVLWAMALLPWALASLVRPHRSLARLLLWSTLLGIAGVYGGTVAGLLVVAGLVASRGRRALQVCGLFLVGQLPWLVPMAVVAVRGSGTSLADSSSFAPTGSGVTGVARLMAGHGFWNELLQVGRTDGVIVTILGAVLLGLAIVGTPKLPDEWRLPLVGVAAIAFVVTVSSAVPGLDRLAKDLTTSDLGAPFRDTQRIFSLVLLWLAPAAALGAVRLSRAVTSRNLAGLAGATVAGALLAVPLAAGLLLGNSGWWGFGGQLDAVRFPTEWAEARATVVHEPGTVVALPWHEYFTTKVAQHRLMLDVVPYYFGGDVIFSSDPELSPEHRFERFDPREPPVDQLTSQALQGHPISDGLVAVGVRWVVLQHDVEWATYRDTFAADPGLQLEVDGPTLSLYRVVGWRGSVVATDGTPVPSSSPISPIQRIDASPAAQWAAPYADGWLRGGSSTSRSALGLVDLPAGSGLVWYWPTVVVVSADLFTVTTLGVILTTAWLRRRRV